MTASARWPSFVARLADAGAIVGGGAMLVLGVTNAMEWRTLAGMFAYQEFIPAEWATRAAIASAAGATLAGVLAVYLTIVRLRASWALLLVSACLLPMAGYPVGVHLSVNATPALIRCGPPPMAPYWLAESARYGGLAVGASVLALLHAWTLRRSAAGAEPGGTTGEPAALAG